MTRRREVRSSYDEEWMRGRAGRRSPSGAQVRGPLALMIAMLAACGDGNAGQQTVAAASDDFCARVSERVEAYLGGIPAAGSGTVVVGATADFPGGMNVFVSADYTANQHQTFVNLMTLLRLDENYEFEPYLARSWTVSDDRTLTFQLRDDVYWHDGTRTSAYDVAFTYERATSPETGFANASYWTHYESVEVVDSFTVRFRVAPHAEALDPWRSVAIMPEHLLGEVAPSDLGTHPFGSVCPVGNGPFRFVEHRESDRWVFEANPRFPQALGGAPAVQRYVYRVIPDVTTLQTELLTGGVDFYVSPPADQAERIDAARNARLAHFPFRQYGFVAWNTRRPQLSDPRVRRAIGMAVDRRGMVDALLQGYGSVAQTGIPPLHWAYEARGYAALSYDPDQAQRLLDEAGWSDRDGDGVRENANGQPLSVDVLFNTGNEQRKAIAEILQAELAEIGIEANPTMIEWGTLLGTITNGESRDFDGVVMGWLPDFKVDESDFFHSSNEAQPLAFAGLQDARIDELLEAIRLESDRDLAQPLWRAYQERIVELQPYTYLYFSERLAGLSERLQDVTLDARGEWVGIRRWSVERDQERLANAKD